MTRYYTHLGTRARERAAAGSEQRNASLLLELTGPEMKTDRDGIIEEPERQQTNKTELIHGQPALRNSSGSPSAVREEAPSLPPELLEKLWTIGADRVAALIALLQT